MPQAKSPKLVAGDMDTGQARAVVSSYKVCALGKPSAQLVLEAEERGRTEQLPELVGICDG